MKVSLKRNTSMLIQIECKKWYKKLLYIEMHVQWHAFIISKQMEKNCEMMQMI